MKVLCGYNANIDAVYQISGREVEALLGTVDLSAVREKICNPPGAIHSPEDFLAGLLICMKSGQGVEWFVHSPETLEFLRDTYLSAAEIRIGGNMGIMSNVLCRLGAELVVPNVVYQSDRQKRLFPCEGILLPECTVCPSDPSDEPVHFVFEFRKGDSFSFGDEKILTPRENRFIASFDEINPNMEISPGFSVYAADHLAVMDGAIISGFHMLQPSYPDGSKFETKAEPVFRQVREWKREKPSLPVHAELGHFVSVNIAEFVFRSLAGIVDSIGMNEDELADLVARIDSPVAGVREMNMGSLLEAAQKCMDVSPDLSTLNIHTRDIVLSVSREKQQVLSCIDSLDFGIRTASAFASTGKLESRLFVEQVSGSLERSVHGLKELDDIGHIIGGVRESAGICGMYGGYEVCAVPTLIAENPAVTVGLGDTFSAASFLRYLEYCTADPRINGS